MPAEHPALVEGRTRYPKTVVHPDQSPRLLVSGYNQRKIGRRVTKGAWSGMPIYCLTLEERATCPRSCALWRDCYGNNMHWSRRHEAGDALLEGLVDELVVLQAEHPHGFVVRLHILGDFYSLDYVNAWRVFLENIPELHVFGFTAHGIETDIGQAVLELNLSHVTRCRIRYSNALPVAGGLGSAVIECGDEVDTAVDVLCPAQTGATDCCGTCALCWSMGKRVVFERH